ncbi:MAG: hypothetical protein JSV93_00115 [Candidatus Omnitrophota bacterium]|nr:MAG: hypothetical protein JSV93_00115 [Candidatus Omnitrophota bacterium]
MKRFAILVVTICFFISAIPVLADSGITSEKPIFQKLNDSFANMGKERPKNRQTAWTSMFQKAKNNISGWNDTSSESFSLRDNKAELYRRRGL